MLTVLRKTVKSLISILPAPIKIKTDRFINKLLEKRMIKAAFTYHSNTDNIIKYSEDDRKYIIKMLDSMKHERFSPFCGIDRSIRQKYYKRITSVHKDKNSGHYYITYDNKKMYFARGMSKKEVRRYFNEISLEQDPISPHRYFTDDKNFIGVINNGNAGVSVRESFGIEKGDVVVDLGGAEGNFSLSAVDLAEKIYIVEADPLWNEALRMTFLPYGSKVSIINKYISDHNDKNSITIDTLLKNDNLSSVFIKFDIEGYEEAALRGSLETIKKSECLKIALCTYHRPQDEVLFSDLLNELGFSFYFTGGYIAYTDNRLPCFRKGLIRAVKRANS